MNRLAGIVAAVVGLIIAALGFAGIVPGIGGAGVGVLLLGLLAIGLSFVKKPEGGDPANMSTASTLVNIFFSPGEVFQSLRRHPRWLAAILLTTVISGTYTILFTNRVTPERIVNFTVDKTLEMSWVANNPEAVRRTEEGRPKAIAEAKNPVVQGSRYITDFVGRVFFTAIFAAIFMLFALAMGGKINFWQAFSATAYASLPYYFIRYVLSGVILFLKDPVEIHPVLGQGTLVQDSPNFLVVPAEHPVLYVLLGAFSLLWFYWIFMNATGLKNAGEKVTGTIAWSASIAIWALGVCLGLFMALMFPGFIS
jgi:Yip1 domain